MSALFAALASGCACSGEPTATEDGGPDTGYLVLPDVGVIDQPCASGIRRIPVLLPPIQNEEAGWMSAFRVEQDVVLAARTDMADTFMPPHPTRGLFARIDAHDGTVLASAFTDLGFGVGDHIPPLAFRTLADGSTEVLFAGSPHEFQGAVARFGADAHVLSVVPLPALGALLINGIVAATETDGGFAVASTGTLVAFSEGSATSAAFADLGLPNPDLAPQARVALDRAPGDEVWLAIGRGQGATVARVDVSGVPRLVSRVEIEGVSTPVPTAIGAIAVDSVAEGAVLSVADGNGYHLRWIDPTPHEVGGWDPPGTYAAVLGVGGAFPNEGIAFFLDGALWFGVASAPGIVSGGRRPLLDGLGAWGNAAFLGTHRFGMRSDGAFTAAVWNGALTLVTLCEAR